MKDNILVEIFSKGTLYLFVQVLLLSDVLLFGAGQVWIYPALIITLPNSISRVQLLFIAFIFGIIIDVFFDTLGIHTASLVLIAFLKEAFLKLFSSYLPSTSNTENDVLSIRSNGFSWFILFAGSLLLIHQICFFMIDASGFSWFTFTLQRIFLSTFFSFLSIIALQYLIYPARSSR